MKHSPARLISRARFKPWHLALCVLLVGWVPSLLVAYLSYGTLGRALDEKITADAQSLTGFLAKFIEDNLVRTGETVDYYRTLPSTAAVLQGATSPAPASPPPTAPPSRSRARDQTAAATPVPSAQEWLGGIFYSQTRVDGLFLTDAAGRLLAAVPPPDPGLLGRDYASEQWKPPADPAASAGFTISPVYPRPSDNRPVTSVVVAVRDRNDTLLGYLGADTLIERMGRRLAVTQLARRGLAATQLIDGRGFPLFTRTLTANRPGDPAAPPALLEAIRARKTGHVELADTAYFFHPIERAGWTAVLEEPAAEVHQPVRDMRSQTVLLVGWLVAGCAVAAYLLSKLYRRQINASLVVEREQVFSENILANMPIGVALIHPNSERLMQANDRFLAIVQSLGALPVGRGLADVGFGELNIAAPGTLAAVVRTGTPFQAVEQRRTAATAVAGNGSPTIYLTLNLLRLQDSKGGVLGVLCLVEDSTEDFTLRQELIDANATKDQFFAQLSHELRTPLSPVITMVAELEQLNGDGAADPAARNALEVIRRNVQLEARLIDDLLDITRIRSGKLGLNREVTNVHRAIRLAIEITQEDLRAKGLRLEVHLDAAHHHADADPARLQQVFWNLIKNAVKFTPAGRRIVIRTSNPEMGNGPAGSAARLRVEVRDEGIGIAPEHLARIFNAFDQGQSGITRRFGGLGLGLAISKALIEAHGGTLAAASAGPDQGATFTVDMDTAAAPAPAETHPAAAAPMNGNRKTILPAPAPKPVAARPGARVLLVDDHHDTCLGMKLLLGRRGYQVTVAHSVAEGLAAAGSEPFDLLISDLGLPDGNGCDLMRALRGRPDGGPPGIALSGFGMESDLEKTAAAGFREHLIKPVDFDRLDAAMHRLLAAGSAD